MPGLQNAREGRSPLNNRSLNKLCRGAEHPVAGEARQMDTERDRTTPKHTILTKCFHNIKWFPNIMMSLSKINDIGCELTVF